MVKQYIFSSKKELLEQAKKDKACSEGLKWAKEQETLEGIFSNIPLDYRLWCLKKGYFQFVENCPWDKLNGDDWVHLLSEQPQFAEHCSWEKLNGNDWAFLLSKQPQFHEHCSWEKLDVWNWSNLLSHQPQLAKYRSLEL